MIRPTTAMATPISVTVLRVVWGLTLVVVPGRVLGALRAPDRSIGHRRIIQVLGARHLVEAVVARRHPSARPWMVVVDVLHACSGLGLAVVSQRWRRAALTDAAVAGGFAVMGQWAESSARSAKVPMRLVGEGHDAGH